MAAVTLKRTCVACGLKVEEQLGPEYLIVERRETHPFACVNCGECIGREVGVDIGQITDEELRQTLDIWSSDEAFHFISSQDVEIWLESLFSIEALVSAMEDRNGNQLQRFKIAYTLAFAYELAKEDAESGVENAPAKIEQLRGVMRTHWEFFQKASLTLQFDLPNESLD